MKPRSCPYGQKPAATTAFGCRFAQARTRSGYQAGSGEHHPCGGGSDDDPGQDVDGEVDTEIDAGKDDEDPGQHQRGSERRGEGGGGEGSRRPPRGGGGGGGGRGGGVFW